MEFFLKLNKNVFFRGESEKTHHNNDSLHGWFSSLNNLEKERICQRSKNADNKAMRIEKEGKT